jgi:hypothetical protein
VCPTYKESFQVYRETSIPHPPVTPGGTALSGSEKAEALADSLETQFQPVTDPSAPTVIEMVDVELSSYF